MVYAVSDAEAVKPATPAVQSPEPPRSSDTPADADAEADEQAPADQGAPPPAAIADVPSTPEPAGAFAPPAPADDPAPAHAQAPPPPAPGTPPTEPAEEELPAVGAAVEAEGDAPTVEDAASEATPEPQAQPVPVAAATTTKSPHDLNALQRAAQEVAQEAHAAAASAPDAAPSSTRSVSESTSSARPFCLCRAFAVGRSVLLRTEAGFRRCAEPHVWAPLAAESGRWVCSGAAGGLRQEEARRQEEEGQEVRPRSAICFALNASRAAALCARCSVCTW